MVFSTGARSFGAVRRKSAFHTRNDEKNAIQNCHPPSSRLSFNFKPHGTNTAAHEHVSVDIGPTKHDGLEQKIPIGSHPVEHQRPANPTKSDVDASLQTIPTNTHRSCSQLWWWCSCCTQRCHLRKGCLVLELQRCQRIFKEKFCCQEKVDFNNRNHATNRGCRRPIVVFHLPCVGPQSSFPLRSSHPSSTRPLSCSSTFCGIGPIPCKPISCDLQRCYYGNEH